jgi:tetratricopeptide (TPR) repeat protein
VERLVVLGRDGPKRRTQLGRELARKGQYRAARVQFTRGLELHPTADGWKAMALLYEQGGDWPQAAQAYEAATALDPQDATVRYKSGFCWLEAGQPGKAIEALEAAAELAPDQRLIQLSLGRARREAAVAKGAAGSPSPGNPPSEEGP